MRILAIETSCDETAVCLTEAQGALSRARLSVLGNSLYSQVALHAPFGGVFPSLAMREHQKNLVPLLLEVLRAARGSASKKIKMRNEKFQSKITNYDKKVQKVQKILEREPKLREDLLEVLPLITPIIAAADAIAVTYGPGLEPALWVGINFARALSVLWDVSIVPINHMEGHIVSALLRRNEISNFQFPISKQILNSKFQILNSHKHGDAASPVTTYQLLTPRFPALALLVSGGHTELILMKKWLDYTVVGETRDDAAGEAFDKVARMLGLPYPGGPAISALAEEIRNSKHEIRNKFKILNSKFQLPRPMLHSPDFDFSFSGLKTAVFYRLKTLGLLGHGHRMSMVHSIALEFENAAVEVLVAKTVRAAAHFDTKTIILGGGVAANMHLRRELKAALTRECPKVKLHFPDPALTGDNATMIATAAYLRLAKLGRNSFRVNPTLHADGNLRLGIPSKRNTSHVLSVNLA